MNEEEIKAQQEAAQQGAPVEAPAGAETESMPAEAPSPRDDFRKEYAGRYEDEDLSDDGAYVDHLRGKLKERDDYEGMVNNLTSAIKDSPVMAKMLVEAGKEHKDEEGNPIPFDPIVYAVESGQLDWEALGSDPEYAKKISEAQKKSLETLAKQKDLDKEAEANLQPTLDMIQKVGDEMGHSDEQKKQIIDLAYQIMGDIVVNKMSEETYRMLAGAVSHDADVEQARQEGQAAGVATKVSDKLRTLPDRPNRTGGRQTPAQEAPAEGPKKRSMFGL